MKILIAGDYRPDNRVTNLFNNKDFEAIFREVKQQTSKADYSIFNLEAPVVVGDVKPITKSGPNLRCDENGIEAIKWAGFDCATLANNHFRDYGDEGVKYTISILEKYGVDYCGGGSNLHMASKVLYKNITGKELSIINCCEHEFSIATETHSGSNPLNPIQQYYAIREAKDKSDFVLVIVHGGHEFWQLPSPRMKEVYRFFIDAGADAVLNHHQHCYSGYEVYKKKPIFYGLGNFFYYSSQSSKLWEEGYMVMLDFDTDIKWHILPYKQNSGNGCVNLLPLNSFDSRLKELNEIIGDDTALIAETQSFYSKSEKQLGILFEPINPYFRKLQLRGLLPSLLGVEQKKIIKNYLNCESHRDKLLWWASNE